MIGYAKVDEDKILEFASSHPRWVDECWTSYFYARQEQMKLYRNNRTYKEAIRDPAGDIKDREIFLRLLAHIRETSQALVLFYRDETASVVGYGSHRFVLPSSLVEEVPLRDYDTVSLQHSQDQGDIAMAMPYLPSKSREDVLAAKADVDLAISALAEEKRRIEDGTAEELSELKAQMDVLMEEMNRKKSLLMEQLKEKQKELEEKVRLCKNELLILDTQIYGIRCYTGEVVSFHHVREGEQAPVDDPVVLFQKVRYLDEELGRYLSLYNAGDKEDLDGTFLSILKARDDMADLFAPGPKSISIVRISRTGTVKAPAEDVKNILSEYAMYHDNQLAVLVRNGKALSIAWLDADKISLDEEFLFYRPQGGKIIDGEEKASSSSSKDMVSRWFIFNILQGILDSGKLMAIPERASVAGMDSPYIVYSMADGWIDDNRFGSFADIMDKSRDIPLIKGDTVLTGSRLRTSNSNRAWDNERGIGERNRTWNASIPAFELLPINKVIPGIIIEAKVCVYEAAVECDPKGKTWYRSEDGSQRCTVQTRDTYIFDGYEPLYKYRRSSGPVRDYDATEEIRPDAWYSHAKSYKSLTDVDLRRLTCRTVQNVPYYIRKSGSKRYLYREDDIKDAYESGRELYVDSIQEIKIIGEADPQYYISTSNEADGWSHSKYNVNFQVYPDEIIPLTFLCPTWLRYVVTTGKIGDFSLCGARMNFADMLRYLNIMLPYTIKRTEEERKILICAGGERFIEENTEWDVLVTEWRIIHKYHSLTKTRAKKFLKEMKKCDESSCNS